MLRIIFIPFLFSTFLFSSSTFTVRLGVFNLKSELQLSDTIDRFTPALKKTVLTDKTDGFIYVYTLPTENKGHLTKLLPAYRKVFSDAYISKIK